MRAVTRPPAGTPSISTTPGSCLSSGDGAALASSFARRAARWESKRTSAIRTVERMLPIRTSTVSASITATTSARPRFGTITGAPATSCSTVAGEPGGAGRRGSCLATTAPGAASFFCAARTSSAVASFARSSRRTSSISRRAALSAAIASACAVRVCLSNRVAARSRTTFDAARSASAASSSASSAARSSSLRRR